MAPGYTSLTAEMTRHQGMAMFKRFRELNLRNLLYMQAEILHLELELTAIRDENKISGDEGKKKYETDVSYLIRSSKESNPVEWNLILDMRAKLKEYSKAV
jgi:hypothetical protein